MRSKRVETPREATSVLHDGATIMVGGFGRGGVPEQLIEAVCERKLRDLTIVSNNAGTGHTGIARLLEEGCVKKIVCSFPFASESVVFKELFAKQLVDLEVVPQGTLAERIRAAGAGLGGFLTRTGLGTEIASGKPVIKVGEEDFLLEYALPADFALIKANKVDMRGNLTYRMAARNFNPIMAMAAKYVIVQAREELPLGGLDPECVVTPGIYVDTYCLAN